MIIFFYGYVCEGYYENNVDRCFTCLSGYTDNGTARYSLLALHPEDEHSAVYRLTPALLLVQAVATSIDALAVGVSFAALDVKILPAVSEIALCTFLLSFIAVLLGKRFGKLLGNKAELLGGVILVGIGLKIFIEHTFFG